jgi:hypothetical protein
LPLGGCDNPTCVFTTGCQGDGGALSDNEARAPVDGEWVVDGPPEVTDVFPTGAQQTETTPVVLVFSESMQEESLEDAFELRRVLGGGTLGPPILGLSSALVSDGRVLLLFPPPDGLDAGDHQLRRAGEGTPVDLTGQALSLAAGQVLATFNVTATPPAAPRLLATFPLDESEDQSATTEIVVVFDRAVVEASVDSGSFSVEVEGAPPTNDPAARPVTARLGVNEVTDTRAWLYRSADADGVAAPLGTDVDVVVTLSPSGDPIREADGGVLAPTSVNFRTLRFAPPLSATLLSQPVDAIGLANLTPGDPEELLVELALDDLETNDSIDLVLFGTQKLENEDEPPLIAVQRALRLTDPTPVTLATFTRDAIGLQFSDAPDDVRFEDGPVTFAFRARRGTLVTPLVVLDLEPDPDLIQDLVLDTEPPEVTALAGSPDTDSFRSDQRDLVLAGTADGELRSVEVSTPLGGNGAVPPVVGSQANGLFLAAPVPVGQLASGTTTYQFTARDVALNSAAEASGTFTQLGSVGPAGFTPGETISIFVFDSRTLLPLADARVLVHSDLGNGTDFPFHVVGTSGTNGIANVTTDPGAAGAIVTVDKPGYDLWTLHGVTSRRLSIPLDGSGRTPARASGGASTRDAAAVALLPGLVRRHDDSRRDVRQPRGFPGTNCGSLAGVFTCQHAATDIRELTLGARSFFAGDFTQTEAAFSAAQLLQAFALQVPQPGVPTNTDQPALLELPFLLIDSSVPDEELAEALPPFGVRVDPAGGVDLADLDTDPEVEGEARVTVETRVPGLGGSIAVGIGLSYDMGGGLWRVRAAQPGAVTAAGPLGADGTVDSDVSVRAELRDDDGNSSGVRPRLSAILAAGADPEFSALDVPAVLAPATNTGGQAFTLAVAHVIDDSRSEGGLYRVDLRDLSGRRWKLWRVDGAGSADVLLRAVDLADGGGTGLVDGSLALEASAWAWQGFDGGAFLWSDVEREFELFSLAGERALQKP